MRETYGGPMSEVGRPNPQHYIETQKMLQTLQPNASQNQQSFLPPAAPFLASIKLTQKKKKFKKKKSPAAFKIKEKSPIRIANETKRNRFSSVNAVPNKNLHSLSNRLAAIYK